MLVPSKLPASDYVVNPYTGCSFACAYCYASFMGRFVGEPMEAWGSYLSVKVNAVDVFRRDLRRLPLHRRHSTILLSSVTDAWQGVEKKYQLARGVLETLRDERYPGLVSMLTKSPLVLRDVDVIAALDRKEVGITLTTTDDTIGRFMEVHAPRASDRLKALADLNAAGIPTYAFVGPLFPHYRYRRDLLEDLFRRIRESGTRSLFVEHLNTSSYILKRIQPLVDQADPGVKVVYQSARTEDHRRALSEMVRELVEKHGLDLRLERVIDHNLDKKHGGRR
ncbi:SPL family radical SAM protein [Pararhodospirillum oryzae]|uniref:Radical SAM protein n=1 Tax=Pararhodospirillum oryzae TaxID=478448 RepID=A0A512H708_9PROT|nr:radical SAM protein [Pararhodospirillum oryzae]GEO81170.1 radical SAM protein [Pararhodospirillum oryzae]